MMRIDKTPDNVLQEVDVCLVQLNTIAKQRHNLVHRLVEYRTVEGGSYLSVSNALTAKSLPGIEAEVFSHPDRESMKLDCMAIFHRLLGVLAHNKQIEDAEIDAFVHAPWRYKPPQRPSGRKQRRRS
jgi:hypothetical protein